MIMMKGTIFHFEERPAESPWIDALWHNYSESGGPFYSMANNRWAMVVTRIHGNTTLTVRGPETYATPAYCPPGAEHFGVIFKLGTYLTALPASQLQDKAVTLPDAAGTSFWLDGSAWQYPSYENFDLFINRLASAGLLVREPIVEAALFDQPVKEHLRSVQRRFLRATGLTQAAVRQIERARFATNLLQQGASILDVVYDAGYSDQPHLTRSLRYFVGLTPAQINTQQLSFLFKTAPFA